MATMQDNNLSPENEEEQEIDKMWNSWNEQSVATIFLDAQRINNVFASIKKQLDYLRDHHSKLNLDFQTFTTGFMQPSQKQVSNDETEGAPVKASSFTPSFAFGNFVNQDEMNDLRNEIDGLRNELRTKFDFEQRIQKIEQVMTTTHRELTHKVEVLLLQLSNTNLDITGNQNQFINFQSEYQITVETLRKLIDEKCLALEVTGMTLNKDMDIKFNQMKDIISIQELKVKQLESKLNNSIENLAELTHVMENFPKTHLDSIHQQLLEIHHEKADRNDLNQKADLIVAISKADQNEFEQLQNYTAELERRLEQTMGETTEKLKTIEQKLDHRSDRIVTWCLKQLRKELKSLNLEHDQPDGTDIGKVRCLVCDRVTSQQKFVSDTVFGGPEFLQTLKGFHRGRSRSPPPVNEQQQYSPQKETKSPSNNQRGHSRLVGMGQSPHDTNYLNTPHGNNYYDQQIEDPDYMADFKYRATSVDATNMNQVNPYNSSNLAGGNNGPTKLPPATKNGNNQGTPLIQITSVHHPDGNSHYGKTAPTLEPPSMNQYRDLDKKIGRKTITGSQSQSNLTEITKKNRPISAPMKRSSTSAKLKPMGKIITDEEMHTADDI